MRIHALSGLVVIGLIGCNIQVPTKGDEAGASGSGSDAGKDSSGTSGSSSGAGRGSGTSGAAAGGSSSGRGSTEGDGGMDSGAGGGGDFTPSNIPGGAAANRDGELTLTGKCKVDGKAGTIECDDGMRTEFGYQLAVQSGPDRADLAVFSVRSLTVAASAQVSIKGPYPVAFVAAETMSINGALLATVEDVSPSDANAGGLDGVTGALVGLGLGAGAAADAPGKLAAGGGAFCGHGGSGMGVAGPGMNGGKPYGNATLTPLMGGSSGGAGAYGASGGGGGALQLVAGVSLNVGLTGAVAAPGGGTGGFRSAGGGSGGAILLEAPSVRIAGMVTANGGGGAGDTDDARGERGRVDGQAAKGGGGVNAGGDGSSSTSVDGGVAKMRDNAGNPGGAGGGGAGWIRINTASGKADITGTLSPSLETTCASVGTSAGG